MFIFTYCCREPILVRANCYRFIPEQFAGNYREDFRFWAKRITELLILRGCGFFFFVCVSRVAPWNMLRFSTIALFSGRENSSRKRNQSQQFCFNETFLRILLMVGLYRQSSVLRWNIKYYNLYLTVWREITFGFNTVSCLIILSARPCRNILKHITLFYAIM